MHQEREAALDSIFCCSGKILASSRSWDNDNACAVNAPLTHSFPPAPFRTAKETAREGHIAATCGYGEFDPIPLSSAVLPPAPRRPGLPRSRR